MSPEAMRLAKLIVELHVTSITPEGRRTPAVLRFETEANRDSFLDAERAATLLRLRKP